MQVSRERSGRRRLIRRIPLPGVMVGRISGDGPLVRAVPNHYGTTFQIAGRAQWSSGRSRWSTSPGTISVKVPGEVFVEHARRGRSDVQVVLFDAALIDQARDALGWRARGVPSHRVQPCDPRLRALDELHRQLLDDEVEPLQLEHAVCAAVASLVDITCAPRTAGGRGSAFSVAVARALALLDERLTEAVTLDELAVHARLDKFQLSRAFRDQVGLPPHAYVTHRRIALAQLLLARGAGQADVAITVGMYDQSLLHRHFKRILGMTPGQFVRAAR